jgi:excisionase family DNA binding protein
MKEPLLATISETGEMIRHGRSFIYRLIGEGRLRTVKAGKRRLIVVASIHEYVESLQSTGGLAHDV